MLKAEYGQQWLEQMLYIRNDQGDTLMTWALSPEQKRIAAELMELLNAPAAK